MDLNSTHDPGYTTLKAQEAFLNLPEGDREILFIQHHVAANAMNALYDANKWRQLFIADLGFSVRICNALSIEGIHTVCDLVRLQESYVLNIPNI